MPRRWPNEHRPGTEGRLIALALLVPGVRPTGENLVFSVESDSRPGIHHRVDLAAFSGFGACQCEEFQFKHQKRIKTKPVTDWRECKHIAAARRFLAIAVAQRLIQQRSQQENPKMTRSNWENPPF
jgi:hypothetical protein